MTQIIVLGAHRSGTSMTAGILHELGVHMGDGINEQGHYEDMAASGINRQILLAAGGIWRKPPSAEAIAAVTSQDDRIARFVERRDTEHAVWGFKDPSTSLTAACWARHMPEAKYIWVQRKTADIVTSMVKLFGWDASECETVLAVFNERIGNFLEGREYLRLEYWRAVRYPEATVATVAEWAGVTSTPAAVESIKRRRE